MVRPGSKNPNWKGGISSVKTADDVLNLPDWSQDILRDKIVESMVIDPVTKCWNWTGTIFKKNNRACISLGKRTLAARVSYALFKGRIGGLLVLHTCDNTLCVNPKHLWLGTNLDNSQDMVAKGRTSPQHGTFNPCAKLTEEIVADIKRELRAGALQYKLAIKHRVCKQTICNINSGAGWGHVE
jgi:hypothetical protein